MARNGRVQPSGGDKIVAWEGELSMELSLECEREEDGRWLAEVPQLPGAWVYATTQKEAMAKAEVLALRVLAEQIEQGEGRPQPIHILVPEA